MSESLTDKINRISEKSTTVVEETLPDKIMRIAKDISFWVSNHTIRDEFLKASNEIAGEVDKIISYDPCDDCYLCER